MVKESIPYRSLCTQYYDLDKPFAPEDALKRYLEYAREVQGPILEPMCGTGRFLIHFLEQGLDITGFDYSPYMLDVCRRKCQNRGLSPKLFEADFGSFCPENKYGLIIIPSSSFCLLTDNKQISQALSSMSNWLTPNGKFIFEVEMLRAIGLQQGILKGSWVSMHDGSQIVLNTLSKFDESSRIEHILCRYELWERNAISKIEVEDFHLKLYEPLEIEQILSQHGFRVFGKWQAEPYIKKEANADAPVIMYECKKQSTEI